MPGNKLYEIEYLETVCQQDITKIALSARKIIKKAIEDRLAVDPIGFGKPLRFSLKGHRRLRVGDYRVIYRVIPSSRTVLIVAIGHRKEVYEI